MGATGPTFQRFEDGVILNAFLAGVEATEARISNLERALEAVRARSTRALANEQLYHARIRELEQMNRALVVQYDAAQGLTHQQASAPSTSTAHSMSKAVSHKRHWRSPPKSRIRTAGGPGTSGLSVSDGADRPTPSSAPPPASS